MNRIKGEKMNKINTIIRAEKDNLSSFLCIFYQLICENKKKYKP